MMAIFQDDKGKIHQAQHLKVWSTKNHFHRKSSVCAGEEFTECWTPALSIQDRDQRLMHLLMEKKGGYIFGQDLVRIRQ